MDEEEGTLTGAFHSFESPAEFESMLEVHLRKLIDRRLLGDSDAAAINLLWRKGSR